MDMFKDWYLILNGAEYGADRKKITLLSYY